MECGETSLHTIGTVTVEADRATFNAMVSALLSDIGDSAPRASPAVMPSSIDRRRPQPTVHGGVTAIDARPVMAVHIDPLETGRHPQPRGLPARFRQGSNPWTLRPAPTCHDRSDKRLPLPQGDVIVLLHFAHIGRGPACTAHAATACWPRGYTPLLSRTAWPLPANAWIS